MILESIIIDNIRSYKHEEVVFPRGISLFAGDIGSGKSTILMCIEFALFGLGQQRPEALLAKKSGSASVLLEFSVGKNRYEIKRTLIKRDSRITQDPKKSWLKANGEKEVLSVSELKQRVLQILRFNEPADPKSESRIFRYAIFTPQEEMKAVLDNKDRRLETVRRAFRIEEYDVAVSNARELQKMLDFRAGVLRERTRGIPEMEAQNSDAKKNIAEYDASITRLAQRDAELSRSIKNATRQLKELQEKSMERARVEEQRRAVNENIAELKRQLAKSEADLGEIKEEEQECQALLNEYRRMERPETSKTVTELDREIAARRSSDNDILRLNAQKSSIMEDVSRLGRFLGDKAGSDTQELAERQRILDNETRSREEYLEEAGKKLDKLREEQARVQQQEKSQDDELSRFSELGSMCPTCKQEITEEHHHSMVDKRRSMLSKTRKDIESIANLLSNAVKERNDARDAMDAARARSDENMNIRPKAEEYSQKSLRIEQINADIAKKMQELPPDGESVEAMSRIRDNLIQYENAIKLVKQAEQNMQGIMDRWQKKHDGASSQREKIAEKMTEQKVLMSQGRFDNLDESIAKNERNIEMLQKAASENIAQTAAMREKRDLASRRMEENAKRINEAMEWKRNLDGISEYSRWIGEFFIPVARQIEKQVLASILAAFDETYRRWYSILIDEPTKTSQINEDFEPVMMQDEYDQRVEYLSGGEKTSVALAYRLTLNSLMRRETESMKSNLLILDEPTDGFSKSQLGKIRELFNELRSDQIILVSHERELEAYVENIFTVSKQDGISRIRPQNIRQELPATAAVHAESVQDVNMNDASL